MSDSAPSVTRHMPGHFASGTTLSLPITQIPPFLFCRDRRALCYVQNNARRDHLPGMPPSRLCRQEYAATRIIVFAVR